MSELAGLRWRNIHADSITIEARYGRGDWDMPKSLAGKARMLVDDHVTQRLHRLKTVEVEVRAGRAVRRYKVVKSDGPDDLVFQALRTGTPIRDNNILVRHSKPAARRLGIGTSSSSRSRASWILP